MGGRDGVNVGGSRCERVGDGEALVELADGTTTLIGAVWGAAGAVV